MTFSIEVVMAAYNDPEVLTLTLEGYRRQKDRNFSLCIADDGSGPEVAEVVDKYRALGLDIRHVWHEDCGFRKAQIVNRGIGTSKADYIILTDSDCVPMRHFIADHRDWARSGHMVAGRRVDTAERLTARIKLGELALSRLEHPLRLILESMRGGLSRAEFGLHLPRWAARLWSRKPLALLGANMGVWREHLMAVNGFDSDFEGYGAEEVDLEWRLIGWGVKQRPMRGRGGLIHIHHHQRQADAYVFHLLKHKQQVGEVVARKGIR
ncbi:glycosyltransferase [Halomonas sp. ML-15]|uniref:glycosyltransferase n=1 Tax=Halomonas sp. ML-15 TaxID=2773305 RepID=UPI001745D93B|nr:glycosyltransferase [Halomonas sp. ML-15]MBD3894569.1 glycosyltransferase [Halomonas sp. ML-15]